MRGILFRLRRWISSERGDWTIQWAGMTLVVLTLVVGSWVYIEKEGKGPIGAVASAYIQAQIDCWEGKPCFGVEYQEGKIDFPLDPCPYMVCEAPPIEVGPPPEPVQPVPIVRSVVPDYLLDPTCTASVGTSLEEALNAFRERTWQRAGSFVSNLAANPTSGLGLFSMQGVQQAFQAGREFLADFGFILDTGVSGVTHQVAMGVREVAWFLPRGAQGNLGAVTLDALACELEHPFQSLFGIFQGLLLDPAEAISQLQLAQAENSPASPLFWLRLLGTLLKEGPAGLKDFFQEGWQDLWVAASNSWGILVTMAAGLVLLAGGKLALLGGAVLLLLGGVGMIKSGPEAVPALWQILRGDRGAAIRIGRQKRRELLAFSLATLLTVSSFVPLKGAWANLRTLQRTEAAITSEAAIAAFNRTLLPSQRLNLGKLIERGLLSADNATRLLENGLIRDFDVAASLLRQGMPVEALEPNFITLFRGQAVLDPRAIRVDVALGRQNVPGNEANLRTFAARLNAAHFEYWEDLGLMERGVAPRWNVAFTQAMDGAIARGGKIHFDLTGLDLPRALAGDPNAWQGRVTAFELQQITRNPLWFNNTTFYLNGRALSFEELVALGIATTK